MKVQNLLWNIKSDFLLCFDTMHTTKIDQKLLLHICILCLETFQLQKLDRSLHSLRTRNPKYTISFFLTNILKQSPYFMSTDRPAFL